MSIVLDGVTKRFGGQIVVERVSLEIADGELFVLLGSSGSGKSTILRIIAGLTMPDAGTVSLHGEDVTRLPPQQRGTGFVFQNYSIFRHMSVAENVEFGLMIRKVPPRERAQRRDALLDLVGLVGLGSRRPHQLSGGQQQRVALARALAYEPRVLLLDEPFGALDAKIRKQIRRSFADIQATLGVTTILVTHDQEEAFDLADRIGVIEHGHLLEVGEPETLYARPRTSFVATFVGAGNVLAGRATQGAAHFGSVKLPIPPDLPHEEGQRVQVLFRPEDIVLGMEGPCADLPLIGRGSIVENAFSGAIRRVRLRLPRLHGTRQVAPSIPFGEKDMLVDAQVPSEVPLPVGEVYVNLKKWLILERPAPRLLALGHPGTFSLAASLADRIDGATTVLGLADDLDAVEGATAELKRLLRGSALRDARLRVRQGRMAEQIYVEQTESLYDMLVLPGIREGGRIRAPWPDTLRDIVTRCEVPTLVANREDCRFQHLLVATAGGEPGKTTVRFAGWLARRLQARVTVLHVVGEDGPTPPAEAHVRAARDDLQALDVATETRFVTAPRPEQGILAEAARETYDLLVVGGHGPVSRSIFGLDDITHQVLLSCEKPVLVVAGEDD